MPPKAAFNRAVVRGGHRGRVDFRARNHRRAGEGVAPAKYFKDGGGAGGFAQVNCRRQRLHNALARRFRDGGYPRPSLVAQSRQGRLSGRVVGGFPLHSPPFAPDGDNGRPPSVFHDGAEIGVEVGKVGRFAASGGLPFGAGDGVGETDGGPAGNGFLHRRLCAAVAFCGAGGEKHLREFSHFLGENNNLFLRRGMVKYQVDNGGPAPYRQHF